MVLTLFQSQLPERLFTNHFTLSEGETKPAFLSRDVSYLALTYSSNGISPARFLVCATVTLNGWYLHTTATPSPEPACILPPDHPVFSAPSTW